MGENACGLFPPAFGVGYDWMALMLVNEAQWFLSFSVVFYEAHTYWNIFQYLPLGLFGGSTLLLPLIMVALFLVILIVIV